MTILRLAIVTLLVASGFGITYWFISGTDVPSASGAFESASGVTWASKALTAGYGFVVTLVGVWLGAIYRQLIKLRTSGVDRIAVRQLVSEVFGSIDFLISLVGAPLAYGLLWRSLSDISFAGLTVIALQNGFTSHAILDQVVNGTAKPTNAPPVLPAGNG